VSAHREIEVTFVIADLAGFTALTETHGSLHALRVVTRYVEMVREALQPGARLAERVGDAVLIVADDAACAVRTAVSLREAADHEPLFPRVRVGIHGGPVIELDGSYFGTPLNLTARLAGHARPGQILCTDRIASTAGALEEVKFRSLGPVRLKNIAHPVDVVEIVPARRPSGTPCVDPVCHMQVSRKAAAARLRLGGRTYYFCSLACAKAFADHPDQEAPR
jgi:adenylate cyclase